MPPKFNLPYQFKITLIKKTDNEPNESADLYLRKGHSETFIHILIKVLAYCYFWDDQKRFTIEPNYRFLGYKPDLISFVPSEIPRRMEKNVGTWVECKDVKIKKLIKLAKSLPRSKIFWFNIERYFHTLLKSASISKRLSKFNNLFLIGIKGKEKDIKFLANTLTKKNMSWVVRQEKARLEITSKTWRKTIQFKEQIISE
jgi:uncharacterized protein YaeQ